jgi:Domain of unknown function (DUF4129)
MDVSSPGEHRRGRRVALVLALLALLLAAVAIASTGHTPVGSGGARRPADQVMDVALSLFVVVMAVGTVLLLVLFVLRRDVVAQSARLRRQRGRSGLVIAAVFFVLLGLFVWALARDPNRGTRQPPGAIAKAAKAGEADRAGDPYEPKFTIWPVLVVAGLAGAGLTAAYISHRARRRALGRGDPELALILADVVEETLDDLRAERDPRKAVIAAYARLERALAAYGLPRRPSEAPEEYVARILGDLEVGSASVQRLTALFARAKFSQHEVDEGMKDEAVETLEELRAELRAAEIRAEEERAAALAEARERAAG